MEDIAIKHENNYWNAYNLLFIHMTEIEFNSVEKKNQRKKLTDQLDFFFYNKQTFFNTLSSM